VKDPRFSAAQVNAAELEDLRELIRKVDPDVVINAVDPRFVMPIFLACEIENTNYIDMAMSLSRPHPHYPHRETGVKLGDEQFARDWNWEERKIYALVGMGVEPGMSDIFAKYANDELFSRIDSITVLDGSNLSVVREANSTLLVSRSGKRSTLIAIDIASKDGLVHIVDAVLN
ncbi:MAG: hypothetical protein RLZZ62_971, partial [Actinomycetota bacterium]